MTLVEIDTKTDLNEIILLPNVMTIYVARSGVLKKSYYIQHFNVKFHVPTV